MKLNADKLEVNWLVNKLSEADKTLQIDNTVLKPSTAAQTDPRCADQ